MKIRAISGRYSYDPVDRHSEHPSSPSRSAWMAGLATYGIFYTVFLTNVMSYLGDVWRHFDFVRGVFE